MLSGQGWVSSNLCDYPSSCEFSPFHPQANPKGRSSRVQVTEDDTSGGDPIQAETENDTELDYDDCVTV